MIDKAYNIEIEGLQVGGQDIMTFDYYALKTGVVPVKYCLRLELLEKPK